MVASVPLLMLASYMIFMAKPGSGQLYLVVWLLVLYAGYSMITLGHAALGRGAGAGIPPAKPHL